MKKVSKLLGAFVVTNSLFLLGVLSIAQAGEGKNYAEDGHFGFLGALTEDMWKGGFVYEAPIWEANLIGHYGTTDGGTVETHVIAKAGFRFDIEHQNFLAVGLEYGFHPGRKEANVDLSSEYQIGPYVAFERYFPGSPVMINIWVNPFQFDHGASLDENGNLKNIDSKHFFQTGGVGIAYLF